MWGMDWSGKNGGREAREEAEVVIQGAMGTEGTIQGRKKTQKGWGLGTNRFRKSSEEEGGKRTSPGI